MGMDLINPQQGQPAWAMKPRKPSDLVTFQHGGELGLPSALRRPDKRLSRVKARVFRTVVIPLARACPPKAVQRPATSSERFLLKPGLQTRPPSHLAF